MCGICGIVTTGAGAPATEQEIIRMRDTLRHRGPDDAGLYIGPGVGLGHRRLSIVDVTGGHQPMFTEDERTVVIFNGEIFNHPMLMPALVEGGARYRTHCDTETILHLFSREGPRFVEDLRGMFAIALWDRQHGTLDLIRDRLGVKPLYFCHLPDGSLVFGSEIKALLASDRVAAMANWSVLPDLLANHAPSGPDTLFAGIRRVPAGHRLRWHNGAIALEAYWQVPRPAATVSRHRDKELIAEYGDRLKEAVRLRLMADVPLGAFLSGGIDSAAIVAVMSELMSEPVRTFQWRSPSARPTNYTMRDRWPTGFALNTAKLCSRPRSSGHAYRACCGMKTNRSRTPQALP